MKKLYRSQQDKKICGLCGGMAEYFNVDVSLLRLIVVVGGILSSGALFLLYVLACLVVPKEPAGLSFGHVPDTFSFEGMRDSFNSRKFTSEKSELDEMMEDVEKKALWKEIEQLKAKLADYEKGANEHESIAKN